MLLGFIYAVAACFIWGLIFVVPEFLSAFSPMEVVLGRYAAYGLFSLLVLLFQKGFSFLKHYGWKEWITAFIFALAANIFYYMGLVAGLRFASPSVTVLVIGLAPITILLYGNMQAKELSYRKLLFPSLWITFGIVLVNLVDVDWAFETHSVQEYLVGVAGMFVALMGWSFYAVHNSRFLKKNPHVAPSDWATVIGVVTLFWVVILGFVMQRLGWIEVSQFMQPSKELLSFGLGVLVLGVLCSWLGCFLWNRASSYLPMALMGPFLIFESIFGLFFIYIVQRSLPSLLELVGIISMLGGVALVFYSFRKSQQPVHG